MLRTWPQEPRRQKNQDAVEAVQGCVMQLVREGVLDVAAVPETAGRPARISAAIPAHLDARGVLGAPLGVPGAVIIVREPVAEDAGRNVLLPAGKDVQQDAMEDAQQHVSLNAEEPVWEDVAEAAHLNAQDVAQDVIQAAEAPVHAVLDVQAA